MNINTLSPITEVHLLTGVPLNNLYRDTITWTSTADQAQYFLGKSKTTFTNLKPVDVNNKIRLPICAYNIYDCNYLMFKNSNFNSKWIYAFIKNIEFINVNVCDITFEMDILQTWLYGIDWNCKSSFVMREHVSDDTIGKHITDEGIDTGEYLRSDIQTSGHLDNFNIILALSYDKDVQTVQGALHGGVYSGLNYVPFPVSDSGVSELNTMIKTICDAGKASMIVSVFMIGTDFITDDKLTPNHYDITPVSRPSNLNGYTPKNNKLYCYPYNLLYVSNNQGKGAIFRWEFFNGTPTFEIVGNYAPTPLVYIFPKNYKINGVYNADEKLTLENFPLCSWNNDVYGNWLANNQYSISSNLITNGVTGAMGAVTDNASMLESGVMGALSQVSQLADRSIQPSQACGNIGGSGSMSCGLQDFFFYPTTITYEYAEKIDNFFERFGYKINDNKIPNITGRPYWNYVKTLGSTVTGSIPFEDISKISTILDNGITFWHTTDVGNYGLNNH